MNRLLTILLLLGATAHGQINNPPTSVNIVDATATGRAVLTATNAAAAATAIGLGTTNDVQFNKALSQSSVIGGGVDAFLHIVTPQQGEIQIGWGSGDFEMDELALTLEQADWKFYKPFSVPNATNRAIIRTNLELGAADNVTFSNITASGTLGVTGNATLNGVDNLAPSQTADSGSSLMTRDLSDARFYPLASYWLKAGDMDTYNGAGAGAATWAEVSPIVNMVTPFSRAPRVVPAADGAITEGIFPIPVGWPAGATVRTTTYFALAPLQSTTDSIFIRTRAYWTTNSSILTPVRTAMGDVFSANTGGDQVFTGTGTNAEYFAVTNTLTFATNANPQNRSIMFGRGGTQATDTATNTIYFIGSHVELLP